MKTALVLVFLTSSGIAFGQSVPHPMSPSKQFDHGAREFVIKPVQRGVRALADRYRPTVGRTTVVAKGVATVGSTGGRLLRYGTPPVVMILPKGYVPGTMPNYSGK